MGSRAAIVPVSLRLSLQAVAARGAEEGKGRLSGLAHGHVAERVNRRSACPSESPFPLSSYAQTVAWGGWFKADTVLIPRPSPQLENCGGGK